MALIAASVRMIDGVPMPRSNYSKPVLRGTLTRLGVEGLKAAGLAIGGYRNDPTPPPPGEEAVRNVVKNS